MKIQRPTNESDWLYQDVNEDRWFTKEACLPDNAADLPECTDAEKVAWEDEHHPKPEPVNEESNE